MPIHRPCRSREKIVSTLSNDPEMRDIVVEFVAEMPQRVRAGTEAFMRGDKLRLQFWAHNLKGSAGGYGFLQITESAAELESTIEQGRSTETIFSALMNLIELCERAAPD